MNVFVQRMVERFGDLDVEDAVAFAETILDGWRRSSELGGTQSVPAQRERNLALVFLNLKYPVQCCGQGYKGNQCADCPMLAYEHPDA